MIEYIIGNNKDLCCGCRACEQVCPESCITMTTDNEGFLYPELNKQSCTNCGICSTVCPIEKENLAKCFNDHKQEVYAAYHKDTAVLKNSSSGGAFSAIVDAYCDKDYVVFGAAYDKDFTVVHSFAQSKDEMQKFRKSKYVQSDMRDCYMAAKLFLESGKKVLFSGTSCQISGLKTFLGKDYPNLFTVDIICHGAPSPALFKKYLDEMKQKYKSDICDISFRDKTDRKWYDVNTKITFANGQRHSKSQLDDLYFSIFLKNIALRPVCYSCPFTTTKRVSDITIADFWGIEKFNKAIPYNYGVSLIITNTSKGNSVFSKASSFMNVTTECFEHAIIGNPNLKRPAATNRHRSQFFADMNRLSIYELADKYKTRKPLLLRVAMSFLTKETKQMIKSIIGMG